MAEQLDAAGDVCGAYEQYKAAMSVNSPKNEPYYATATQSEHKCHPYVPPTDTPEGTPSEETPTEEPTPTS